MPTYQYIALDEAGKRKKGSLDAQTTADLQTKLKTDGLYLLSSGAAKVKQEKQLKATVLSDFCRQVGSLVGAGVSLVRALSIIADEEDLKPRYRKIYGELNRAVRRGTPLSQAMEEQNGAFPWLMIYMFRSAEASGNMEDTAMKMADQYQKDHNLMAKVKSSTTYPKILSVLIVLVVAIIMGYVMPQFKDLFANMEKLPWATTFLFAISNFVSNYWFIAIPIVIGVVVGFKILSKIPQVKYEKDKLVLRIPAVGKLMSVIYTARFARTLSSLYSCGISIVNCLKIARNVIGNTYIESQFGDLISFVQSGRPLSEGLSRVKGFSKKLSSTVRVGEESGELDNLLVNVANTFEYDSEQALNRLVSYIEPVMIIVMAIIVALIMYAVVMPIYGSYSAIGSM